MANYYLAEDTSGSGRLAVRWSTTWAFVIDLTGAFLVWDRGRYSGSDTTLARKKMGLTSQFDTTLAYATLSSRWWCKVDGTDAFILAGDAASWSGSNNSGAGNYEPVGSPDNERDYLVRGPLGSSGSDLFWQMFAAFSFGTPSFRFEVWPFPSSPPATARTIQIGCRIDGALRNVELCGFGTSGSPARYRKKVHRESSFPTLPGVLDDLYVTPGLGTPSNSPSLVISEYVHTAKAGAFPAVDVPYAPELVAHGPAGYTPWDLDGGDFDEGDPVGSDSALYLRWPQTTIDADHDRTTTNVTIDWRLLGGYGGNRVGAMGGAPLV